MKLIPLVLIVAAVWSTPVGADERIVRPAVPPDLVVDAAFRLFLTGHAYGTQNYICAPAPTASGLDWVFIGPQATLFNERGEQIITHFFSKNPSKADAIQATWQHSRDSSATWAVRRVGSLDAAYVAPNSIEWLLLDVTGGRVGPLAGDRLASTKVIQRVNTRGGMKPPTDSCTVATLNTKKFVDYEADYYFYD